MEINPSINDLYKQIIKQLSDQQISTKDNKELIKNLIGKQVSEDINKSHRDSTTFGDRLADKIAAFTGSWKFIIGFFVFFIVWVVINTVVITTDMFDPYPFNLLNLVLSSLCSVQSLVIIISQNRQTNKDRMVASNDYLLNVKHELISEDIYHKLETLITQQQKNTEVIESTLDLIKNEIENK